VNEIFRRRFDPVEAEDLEGRKHLRRQLANERPPLDGDRQGPGEWDRPSDRQLSWRVRVMLALYLLGLMPGRTSRK
jgi:hypothetical protein